MIEIQIAAPFTAQCDPAQLRLAAETTLRHQSISPQSELSLLVTDDAQIADLNHRFRGIRAPTDVLSFPAHDFNPETGLIHLGDVIISFPQAEKQAAQGGHSTSDELMLLTVHGILHLLGHDHAHPEEKARMWSAQVEILGQIGASPTLP